MQHCHPAIRPLTYSVRVRWDALLREWVDCHSAVFFDFGDKLELDESSIVRWAPFFGDSILKGRAKHIYRQY